MSILVTNIVQNNNSIFNLNSLHKSEKFDIKYNHDDGIYSY